MPTLPPRPQKELQTKSQIHADMTDPLSIFTAINEKAQNSDTYVWYAICTAQKTGSDWLLLYSQFVTITAHAMSLLENIHWLQELQTHLLVIKQHAVN
jgi:hypothetical protein